MLKYLDPIGRPITAEELRRNCGYRTKAEVAKDPEELKALKWTVRCGVYWPTYTIEQLMAVGEWREE